MRQLRKLLPDQVLLTKVRTMLSPPLFSLAEVMPRVLPLTQLSSDFRCCADVSD